MTTGRAANSLATVGSTGGAPGPSGGARHGHLWIGWRRLRPHLPAIVAAVVTGLIVGLWFAASLGIDDRAEAPADAKMRTASLGVGSSRPMPTVDTSTGEASMDETSTAEISTDAPAVVSRPPMIRPAVMAARVSAARPTTPRISALGHAQLMADLEQSTPIVGLEYGTHSRLEQPGTRLSKLTTLVDAAAKGRKSIFDLRPELANFAFLGDDECGTDPKALDLVKKVSQTVRQIHTGGQSRSGSSDVAGNVVALLNDPTYRRPEAVRTIVQMLQVENNYVRTRLVAYLSEMEGPDAERALVDRALFDLHPDIREDAAKALARRPLDGYRERLLAGFRHPWPAVAEHAADAVVALAKTDAIEEATLIADLEKLVDLPDPRLAVKNGDHWRQTEMVGVNHLSNCLLCHPMAERTARLTVNPEGLVASIPSPTQPLTVQYYSGLSDSVRGDIVFLRQDFSVVHLVDDYAPWPAEQRFDYIVRTRPATSEEIARAQAAAAGSTGKSEPASYRHRDAVLFALTQLRSAATSIATR